MSHLRLFIYRSHLFHLFPVTSDLPFPAVSRQAARQLLQVEHYDAVVEERSLENLCGHPPCSEAVVEVPERNLDPGWRQLEPTGCEISDL